MGGIAAVSTRPSMVYFGFVPPSKFSLVLPDILASQVIEDGGSLAASQVKRITPVDGNSIVELNSSMEPEESDTCYIEYCGFYSLLALLAVNDGFMTFNVSKPFSITQLGFKKSTSSGSYSSWLIVIGGITWECME